MKSHVSDLLSIVQCVIIDAYTKCSTSQDSRDMNFISRRVRHEGLSFLTITLPNFGKDFEKSLDLGEVPASLFAGFRKRGRIPAFLQGIFGLVFNPIDGRILQDVEINAIEGIRQISYTFKKLETAYSSEKLEKAISNYLEDEQSIRSFSITPEAEEEFSSVCHATWDTVLNAIRVRETVPRHGPGATAGHTSGNQKYANCTWHYRLEPFFPFYGNATHSESVIDDWRESESSIDSVDVEDELPVQVVFVPKTGKGPRTIAMEPVCMQYTQQALSKALISAIEKSKICSGHVNFTDQSINRSLAIGASVDRSLSTLDLSSASDRVPWSLVKRMLSSSQDFLGATDACRSRRAQINGDLIDLHKFASMGSALCFPIESMYFFTLCTLALLRKQHLPPTVGNCYAVTRSVYVYGDDLIVPTRDVDAIVATLQEFNCKVNVDKSFWKGYFRESCGMDAYLGYEVTPTYVRQAVPTNRRMSKHLISWNKSSNLFYKKGYWKTADFMMNKVESLLGTLPLIHETCAGLGKTTFQVFSPQGRWNKDLQCTYVHTWVPSPVYQRDKLGGYPALLKCLLRLHDSNESVVDTKHLERSARRGAVTLKRRWISPF